MSEEKRPILLTRPLSDEEKWQLVQRVAASAPFQKAARLREFLLYVSERTLRHDLDNTRESNIGYAVFGRSVDYNPGEDNIVRVEARHLRKRLADFFENEGKNEPYVIVIPKGSYVPVFLQRESAHNGAEAAIAEPVIPAADLPAESLPATAEPLAQKTLAHPLVRYVIVGLLLAAVLLCAVLLIQNRRLESQIAAARPLHAVGFPWTAVLNQGQTKIVLADSCLALLGDAMGQRINLNDYVSRSYLNSIRGYGNNPALRSVLETIAGRQYTSLADVLFVSRIMQLTGGRQNFVLTYARNLNIRDFKADNFILIGSRRANPWVELFEPKMNFLFEFDSAVQRPFFRNRSARPGEQPTYVTTGADGRTNDSYAVVALVPNLNRTGNVLIIEGTNMEGTEAGIEYLTDPDFAKQIPPALASKVAQAGGAHPLYFEILLKLRTVGGTSESVEPIAYRILND